MKTRTTIVMLAFVSPAVLLAYAGVTNHLSSAYAQGDNPLSKVPVIGEQLGGGENQSQQGNQSQQQNQSGSQLSKVPVIGEQLEKVNPMK
jgi:hypothetical protein